MIAKVIPIRPAPEAPVRLGVEDVQALLRGQLINYLLYGESFRPGQILWVQEPAYIAPAGFGQPSDGNVTDHLGRRRIVGYEASMDADAVDIARAYGVRRTPAKDMPRWASRLTVKVSDVPCCPVLVLMERAP